MLNIMTIVTFLAKTPWYEEANGIIGLITGAIGLITAAVGVFFAVKNFIKNLKGKKASEIWGLIKNIADNAMKEAEASSKKGADKKQMVIDAVKAGCKAAGINADEFLDQLSDYIDQSIAFVNDMKDKK